LSILKKKEDHNETKRKTKIDKKRKEKTTKTKNKKLGEIEAKIKMSNYSSLRHAMFWSETELDSSN